MFRSTSFQAFLIVAAGALLGYVAANEKVRLILPLDADPVVPPAIGCDRGDSVAARASCCMESDAKAALVARQGGRSETAWPKVPAQEVLPFPPHPSPTISGRMPPA